MIDWKSWVLELPNATIHANVICTILPDNREQRVKVLIEEDSIRLQSAAAKRAAASRIRMETPDAELFDRNGSASPIGIAFGPYGSLVFEACLPLAGLEKAEFQAVLLDIAQEADLFEFRYTGEDRL